MKKMIPLVCILALIMSLGGCGASRMDTAQSAPGDMLPYPEEKQIPEQHSPETGRNIYPGPDNARGKTYWGNPNN